MFTLGSKLNRSYILHIPFMRDFCEISILFNKSSSFVGYNLDHVNFLKSRDDKIKCFIFDDLSKSAFATAFLDIRDFRSKNLDIKQQFNNILPDYKNRIHYETNETIKLSKVTTSQNTTLESCIYIYVFRFTDFGNDFLYCLTERQHIDTVLDKKIVRTAAIQISSPECHEDLTTMIEMSNRRVIQSESVDSIKDLFSERKDVRK